MEPISKLGGIEQGPLVQSALKGVKWYICWSVEQFISSNYSHFKLIYFAIFTETP